MIAVRCHTFGKDRFTLWADRVPAIHGRVNLFTLWEHTAADGVRRLIGGVTSDRLRTFIKETFDAEPLEQAPVLAEDSGEVPGGVLRQD